MKVFTYPGGHYCDFLAPRGHCVMDVIDNELGFIIAVEGLDWL